MSTADSNLAEFHWLMDVLQTIDVGILVVRLDNRILAWNSFMENHSGISPDDAIDQDLFEVFPDLPRDWFEHKSRTVVQLKNRAFTTWEQRPYLFRFKNNRPITGAAEFMYQNCTFIPVTNIRGDVESLCIIVYDVTDEAINKLEQQRTNAQLQELSRLDGLTALYNRGYWEQQLEQEFHRQKRALQPTSLVIFDIDHFKKLNDINGHLAGDSMLRQVAEVVRQTIRASDVAGRFGGEEFALILPDTPPDDAVRLAERLREQVAALVVDDEQAGPLQVTISLGVAGWHSRYQRHQDWMIEADQALYRSKAAGRNCVTLA